MQKTSQFKTQCKGDKSHSFETAKITVFDPTVCINPVYLCIWCMQAAAHRICLVS